MWAEILGDAARLEPSARRRDLPRMFWQWRGLRAVAAYRLGRRGAAGDRVAWALGKALGRWVTETQHVELPVEATIGPGFVIHHGFGVVVHRDARIGADVTLCHHVCLGVVHAGPLAGAPTIEDGVFVGPGAIIIGRVTVGRSALVGAGAVVVRDVPAGAVVAGNPARVVTTSEVRAAREAAAAEGASRPG